MYAKVNLIVSIAIMVTMVILVLLKLNRESSVLTVFMVTLIFNYLNGLAMSSIPGKCNPFHQKTINKNNFLYSSLFHILANTLLATLAVTYATLSKKKADSMNVIGTPRQEGDVNENLQDNQADSVNESTENIITKIEAEQKPEENHKKTAHQFMKFHLVMMFLSIYMGTVFISLFIE